MPGPRLSERGFFIIGTLWMGSETIDRPCQATPASWRSEGGCLQRIVQRQSIDVAISEEIVGSESVGVAGDGGDLGHGRAFAVDGREGDSGVPRRGPSGRRNRAVVDSPGPNSRARRCGTFESEKRRLVSVCPHSITPRDYAPGEHTKASAQSSMCDYQR